MLVSTPRTWVVWNGFSPPRTSRHTGALFRGCSCCRCACSCAVSAATAHAGASANMKNTDIRRSVARMSRIPTMRPSYRFLVTGTRGAAGILVLAFVPLLDGVFPGQLVSLELVVLPRQAIGLALVLALLVDGDRGLLAAARCHRGQSHGRRYRQ